jgi:hypothetical protein
VRRLDRGSGDTDVVTESSESADGIKDAAATLSELAARILQQLALSAWLPAAALTLLVAFILELGAALDNAGPTSRAPGANQRSHAVGSTLGRALAALGKIHPGALVLLGVVVVVLTMLTQAFSFESIRLMEGYWGINRLTERLAEARARHFRKVAKELDRRYRTLTKRAWKRARVSIAAEQERLRGLSLQVRFTDEMITALGDQVLLRPTAVHLTDEQRELVNGRDWEADAPPDLLRRRINLLKRRDDFPNLQHVVPTRLGNVLRHYEDATGYGTVESLVDDVFDSIPASLRISHDEQRGRLDLYCSMTVVLGVSALIAAVRFGRDHWGYGLSALIIGLVGSWMTYRAAVASARYYGSLLVSIARYVSRQSDDTTSLSASAS